jgi:hypothetical protein
MVAEEKIRLRDGYEELRSYAISPLKALSHPLGLDLWCKKGFITWIDVMLYRGYPAATVQRAPIQPGSQSLPHELPISLANIIIDWRKANG